MGWQVAYRQLDTADMSGTPTVYQKVIFPRNVVIRGFQTWFVVYNNPTFTNIYFQVYSLQGTTPKKLIYTSTNVWTKAELHTLAYGIKGFGMIFDDVVFRANETYAFVPRGTSYTGNTSAHLGWKLGFPDPAYRTNVPLLSRANMGRSPYDITGFVGDDL